MRQSGDCGDAVDVAVARGLAAWLRRSCGIRLLWYSHSAGPQAESILLGSLAVNRSLRYLCLWVWRACALLLSLA